MCEAIKELEAWGCDTRKALFNVMDDMEFYERLLKQFLLDPSVAGLQEAVRNGDSSLARQLAHQIKGTSATLGLDPLNRVICVFLDGIRSKDPDRQELQRCYRPVEKQLEVCSSILKKV